jgi:hypothetical protein
LVAARDFLAGAIFSMQERSPSQVMPRTGSDDSPARNLSQAAVFANVNDLLRLWRDERVSVADVDQDFERSTTRVEEVDLIFGEAFGAADFSWEPS